CRLLNRRLASPILWINSRLGLNQHADGIEIARGGRQMNGRSSVSCLGVHIVAALNQFREFSMVPPAKCHVDTRPAEAVEHFFQIALVFFWELRQTPFAVVFDLPIESTAH